MNFGNETGVPKTAEELNCSINYKSFQTDGDAICQIVNCIFNSLTSVTATVANLFVIISIWRTPSLHSPSNVLLMGLALSDFSVGLVVQPIFQVTLISKINGLANLYCSGTIAQSVAGYSLCGVSMLTLTAISLDRFIAIHLHLRYREIVTAKRLIVVLVFIWLVSIISACSLLWSDFTFIGHLSTAVILLGFSVTGFSYCMIYRVVRRHRTQIHSHLWAQVRQQDSARNLPQLTKSSWSMFLINFAFVLCVVPYLLIRSVMQATDHDMFKQSLYEVAILLIFTNSALNPILYCWRFRQIRIAVTKTAKILFNIPRMHNSASNLHTSGV